MAEIAVEEEKKEPDIPHGFRARVRRFLSRDQADAQEPENNWSFNDKRVTFVNSYYFSQGDPRLQSHLIRYLKLLNPEWRIEPGEYQELKKASLESVRNYLKRRPNGQYMHEVGPWNEVVKDLGNMTDAELEAAAGAEFKNYSTIVNNEYRPMSYERNKPELIRRIAVEMIARDYDYLHRKDWWIKNKPRVRNMEENEPYSPRKDKFLSQLCYYGLEGNTTGHKGYDQIFKDVVAYLKTASSEELDREGLNVFEGIFGDSTELFSDASKKLKKLISTYNKTHPGHNASLGVNEE